MPTGTGMYQNGFPIGYPTNNLFNPQPSPYAYNTQQTTQNQQNQVDDTRIYVEGEEAAKAYLVKKNTIVDLWDTKEPKIYLKMPDKNGNTTTVVLKYEVIEPPKLEDKFITRDEFVSTLNSQLSRVIDELKGALRNERSTESSKSTEPIPATV